MSEAKKRFTIGQPVKLSARGVVDLTHGGPSKRIGKVVGFGHSPWTVRIRHEGIKGPITYHIDYWEAA